MTTSEHPDRGEPPGYAAQVSTSASEVMGWLRASVGVALLAAPGAPMRLAGTEAPTGAALLLMRTIGIRDLVLGLGTVSAARSARAEDSRRWTRAAMTSDALDTVVSLAAIRSVGRRDSLVAAALAFGFTCGDVRALRTIDDPAAADRSS